MSKQKDLSSREKTRIAIQDLKSKGLRQCEIIRMGYSSKLVKTWYHRDSYKEVKGKGRKGKLTDEIKERIDNEMKAGVGTRTVAKILAVKSSEEGREWTPKRSTIRKYIKSTANKSILLKNRPKKKTKKTEQTSLS